MNKTEQAKLAEHAHKALDKFLEHHRESDGGYAAFTDGDESDFYKLIDRITQAKFSPDGDGDRPLQVKLINRTYQEPCSFLVVPYLYQITTLKDALSYLRSAEANIKIACDQVRLVTYQIEEIEKERTKGGKT